jgi:outer membrane protein assembly factor BamB
MRHARFDLRPAAAALLALAATMVATPVLADPLGRRPTYSDRPLSAVPNAGAITAQIWAPGLDDGFVPQGIAAIGGALYVSSYHSESRDKDRGLCRLYRIDPRTGNVTATLDLPAACGHAGGLAKGPPGTLFVADTWTAFEVKLNRPGDGALGNVTRTFKLTGTVRGSFAAGSADALWLGTYTRQGPGHIHKFPFAKLAPELGDADASLVIPLPERSQGAAFDAQGRLWTTQSSGSFGSLTVLDAADGKVLKRYDAPVGIEDASFDDQGGLWSLSESGSKRWLGWAQFYPLLFRLDVGKLQ